MTHQYGYRTQNILVSTLYPDPQDRALAAGLIKQSTNFAYMSGTAGYGQVLSSYLL